MDFLDFGILTCAAVVFFLVGFFLEYRFGDNHWGRAGRSVVSGLLTAVVCMLVVWMIPCRDYNATRLPESYQYRVLCDSNRIILQGDRVPYSNIDLELMKQDPNNIVDVEFIIQDWHIRDGKCLSNTCWWSYVPESNPNKRNWKAYNIYIPQYTPQVIYIDEIVRIQRRVGWGTWVDCVMSDVPLSTEPLLQAAWRSWENSCSEETLLLHLL